MADISPVITCFKKKRSQCKKDIPLFYKFYSIISLHALKLVLNKRIRASDDEQGINKLRPKVNTTIAGHLRFTIALTVGVKKTENEFNSFRLPPLLTFKNLVKATPGILWEWQSLAQRGRQ